MQLSQACPIATDHRMVTMELLLHFPDSRPGIPSVVFDYPKADWEGLINHLLDEDLSFCQELEDVDAIWASIKLAVTSAMETFIPKVRIHRRT